MSLVLTADQAERISQAGRDAYPEECCGFLVGQWETAEKRVHDVRPAPNARSDSRHNRYLIPPEEFLRAEKAARERGLDIVGFYHSHPDVEARPSAFDRDHAWAGYSYVIVSVRGGAAQEILSWELPADRSEFAPEKLVILADAPTETGPLASEG